MGAAMEIVFAIIFFAFAMAANAKKNNANKAAKPATPVQSPISAVPREVGSRQERDDVIEVPSFMRAQKPTVEKTHSHKGEVSHTVLLEDRDHDWLASQIKEEARLARKRMQ